MVWTSNTSSLIWLSQGFEATGSLLSYECPQVYITREGKTERRPKRKGNIPFMRKENSCDRRKNSLERKRKCYLAVVIVHTTHTFMHLKTLLTNDYIMKAMVCSSNLNGSLPATTNEEIKTHYLLQEKWHTARTKCISSCDLNSPTCHVKEGCLSMFLHIRAPSLFFQATLILPMRD